MSLLSTSDIIVWNMLSLQRGTVRRILWFLGGLKDTAGRVDKIQIWRARQGMRSQQSWGHHHHHCSSAGVLLWVWLQTGLDWVLQTLGRALAAAAVTLVSCGRSSLQHSPARHHTAPALLCTVSAIPPPIIIASKQGDQHSYSPNTTALVALDN